VLVSESTHGIGRIAVDLGCSIAIEPDAQRGLEAALQRGDARIVLPDLGTTEVLDGRKVQRVHVEQGRHRLAAVSDAELPMQGLAQSIGQQRFIHGTDLPEATTV